MDRHDSEVVRAAERYDWSDVREILGSVLLVIGAIAIVSVIGVAAIRASIPILAWIFSVLYARPFLSVFMIGLVSMVLGALLLLASEQEYR